MTEEAKQVYSGDIVVPKGFKWVIECKGGYEDDMDAWHVVDGSLKKLDEFIKQVSHDAGYTGRKPIICWKRNRRPWLACIRWEDFTPIGIETLFPNRIQYVYQAAEEQWVIVSLEKLFEHTSADYNFWFEGSKS